jgi:ribosomal protein L37E
MLDKKHGFYSSDGKPYLIRCPMCEHENHAMAVADGMCAWCGYEEPSISQTNEGQSCTSIQ